jgi:diguanylate cyclase (GGDEF)-like protein/PAS domain S-box-containing protein
MIVLRNFPACPRRAKRHTIVSVTPPDQPATIDADDPPRAADRVPLDAEAKRAVERLVGLSERLLSAEHAFIAVARGDAGLEVAAESPAQSDADVSDASRELLALCEKVMETGRPLSVEDARAHDAGRGASGAFLGVPLLDPAGVALGVLAVVGKRGRLWAPDEVAQTEAMAASVVSELEIRRATQDRLRAQAALHRSELLYRQLVESASDIIYRADRMGFFMYANPATVRLTGYSEEDLAGMHFRDVVRPDYRDRLTELYADQVTNAVPTTYFELPIITKTGREMWIGQNVQLLWEEHTIAGVQAVARDITRQREVEGALRESEKRFRNVVENLGEGLVITNLTDTILYANSRITAMTGYTVEELLGRVAHEALFPEQEWQRGKEELRKRSLGISSCYEVPHVRKNGTVVWLEVNAVPYRNPDGVIVGSLALIEDIGERKRAEQALRESEERYRLMVEGSEQVFFYVHDPEHRFEYLSPSVTAVLGYAPEELVGRPYDALLAGDPTDEEVHARTEQALISGEGFSSYTVVTAHKDGRLVPIEVVETPIVRDGEVIGMQGFARDITERQRAKEALERSEEYFRSLTENTLDVIHVINADRSTRYVSPSVTRLLGYRPEELVGRSAETLIHPEDVDGVVEMLRGIPRGAASDHWEFRVRHRDGSWRTFEGVARNLLEDPVVAGMVINSRDITDRKRAETEIVRLAALSRENPNPVLECDEQGRSLHVNPAAERISRDLGAESISGLLPDNHLHLVRASLENGEGFQNVEVTVAGRIFSWTYRPHADARVVYLFAVDITTRRHMEEQLRHDALHDALTGLPNRLLFMERLAHAILRAKRRVRYQFAVLFLDLDRFKVINDSLGHHVGDDLLVMVAKRLQSCLRAEDSVARLGGDEFAILLEDIQGVEDATRIAERIQQELSTPLSLSGFDVFTSASIGIALSSTAYERPEYLLRNADMAMYRAKAAGQARFEVFDRAMHAQALTRLQLETDLRRAVDRQEFRLHYQPIVALGSGRLDAVEALVRWEHPDRGWMAPDEFIPVAEETGVILPIGEWVLTQACAQGRAWLDRFGEERAPLVGVNLSAKQFSQPDLAEQISKALDTTGLPAARLRLEITESAIMENAESATVLLGSLKALGVQISLDDFGTGYSSLSYLHRFPLDALKIDRSFVMRMHEDDRSAQLVQTIIGLARSLGVVAVAEGIEMNDQFLELRRIDCEFGQGYLFARPLAATDVEIMLEEGWSWTG